MVREQIDTYDVVYQKKNKTQYHQADYTATILQELTTCQ